MNWQEKTKQIPSKPGVYLFYNTEKTVIYVGKAVSLKSRVRSYFGRGTGQAIKTRTMVAHIEQIEYIVTDTEVEALILECNLIKEHRPRYNVLLKDDKSYPYIKVTLAEDYPRVISTRQRVKDGSRYFGPYTQVGAMNETLRLIKHLFPFRTCSERQFKSRHRSCLNFHIKRCLAPCVNQVDQERYISTINEIILFLEGRQDHLIKRLAERMRLAAENLNFELAVELRDQMLAVKKVTGRQKIVSAGLEDQDVIALASSEGQVCAMVFFVRSGKLIGREHYLLEVRGHTRHSFNNTKLYPTSPVSAGNVPINLGEFSAGELLSGFLKQYYHQAEFIPRQVLLSEDIATEAGAIADWLSQKRGSKVLLKTPVRGEKAKLVAMVAKNALLVLQQHLSLGVANQECLDLALAELVKQLGLAKTPGRMECFDISNIQGAEQVAAMVVFKDGKPASDQYRRFKIRTVEGPNDFAAMQEVIYRRFSRGLEERGHTTPFFPFGKVDTRRNVPINLEAKFYPLPDLVIIDGGKGQLSAVRSVMKALGVANIPTFGLAKKEELLFHEASSEPIVLPSNSQALYLVQRIRDEAHRFAITYHRNLRTKRNLKSLLDEIEGVGPARRRALLQAFKTIVGIEKAALAQLQNVPSMNRVVAEAVYNFFRQDKQ